MRKYVVLTVVCMSLLAVSAMGQSGEVYSLNVVGFQKINASSQGLTMVSTPFARAPSNTLDDVIGDQLYGHKSSLYADNITLWDVTAQEYINYTLKPDGLWYDFDNNRATNTSITPLLGFWVDNKQKLSNEIFVVSGDVVDDPVVTNSLVVGLSLVSYPFSTEININSSGLTNGYAHKSSLYADNLTVWDDSSQSYKSYSLKTDHKWYDFNNNLATDVVVGAGKGFWYENRGATTFEWVETRPYTL